jgi:hypothetical protein
LGEYRKLANAKSCETKSDSGRANSIENAPQGMNSSSSRTGYFKKSGSYLCQAQKGKRFEFMKNHVKEFKIVEMASVLEVSVSGDYSYCQRGPSQRVLEDRRLLPLIQ